MLTAADEEIKPYLDQIAVLEQSAEKLELVVNTLKEYSKELGRSCDGHAADLPKRREHLHENLQAVVVWLECHPAIRASQEL